MFHPPFGMMQIELPGAPGAGLDFVYTVPTGVIASLMSMTFRFVTDANAADRSAMIQIQHAAFIVAHIAPNVSQAASLDYRYTFAPGLTLQTAVPNLRIRTATPHPLWLMPGDTIRSLVTNIQVGDVINGIYIYLNQYAA